jgi:hypothetical protein
MATIHTNIPPTTHDFPFAALKYPIDGTHSLAYKHITPDEQGIFQMAMFRRKADQIIDDAHNRICSAEMMLMHSFTDESKATAHDELSKAQRYLRRACDAKRAWDAIEHDDYEEYPEVPYNEQSEFSL